MKDLINNIIENEFKHVQTYEERNFLDTDEKQLKLEETSKKLFEALYKSIPEECQGLLDDYCDAVVNEWINLCRFYFKEGARAGLANLNFLKSIEDIGCYIN